MKYGSYFGTIPKAHLQAPTFRTLLELSLTSFQLIPGFLKLYDPLLIQVGF